MLCPGLASYHHVIKVHCRKKSGDKLAFSRLSTLFTDARHWIGIWLGDRVEVSLVNAEPQWAIYTIIGLMLQVSELPRVGQSPSLAVATGNQKFCRTLCRVEFCPSGRLQQSYKTNFSYNNGGSRSYIFLLGRLGMSKSYWILLCFACRKQLFSLYFIL